MNMQVKIKDLEEDITYYLTPNGGWSFVSGDLLRHMLLQSGLSEDTEITAQENKTDREGHEGGTKIDWGGRSGEENTP